MIYKNTIITLMTIFSLMTVGWGQEVEWSQVYGGVGNEYGYSVQQTSDGGYIVTGTSSSFGNGYDHLWLLKTDSLGNEEWNQIYGGLSNEYGYSVQQTSDGGYIVTGRTESYGNGGTDLWLLKTDSLGNEEWNQTYGGSSNDSGSSVQQTSDGGYIVTGNKGISTDLWWLTDIWLIKTDSLGNEEWNQTYGGLSTDHGYSVQQTSDGGYIVTGRTESYGNGGTDLWLIKTDSLGNEEWNQTYGGSSNDSGSSVQQTSDGGYIVTGNKGINGTDIWLIKTDSLGNEEWNQIYGGLSSDHGYSLQQTSDGGYIITGFTGSFGWGYDLWLIKTDSLGNEEWNQTYGGSGGEDGMSVQQTSDGGYIVTGHTNSFGNGGTDLWLLKTQLPSPCNEETEVELWGECYNIEETTSLNLDNSGLTGEIPPEIGNLTNLTYLNLRENDLYGHIPSEIGNLINLTHLDISLNQLNGEIPSTITNLSNLILLRMYGNDLSGQIPEQIGLLTNLTTLNIHTNQLSGEIPSDIGNLINLTYLGLRDNQFSGLIPQEICNQGDEDPELENNLFCPYYPECLSQEDVGYQDIINCDIQSPCNPETEIELWVFNECFNIIETTEIDYSGSNFTGEIPGQIGSLINLELLNLEGNQFSGEIPSEIGNLINLTHLDLQHNQLNGEIPLEIGNLTNLENLNLSSNELTGQIPSQIGNLINLTQLSLQFNQFTQTIPIEICNLNLFTLSLQHNQLNGEIPSCLCESTSGLELMYNELSGSPPECLCDISFSIYNNNLCPPYLTQCDGIWNVQNDSNCPYSSMGDVNFDGNINIYDIMNGIQIILGNYQPLSDLQLWVLDYNYDNSIDIIDIQEIVNLILYR